MTLSFVTWKTSWMKDVVTKSPGWSVPDSLVSNPGSATYKMYNLGQVMWASCALMSSLWYVAKTTSRLVEVSWGLDKRIPIKYLAWCLANAKFLIIWTERGRGDRGEDFADAVFSSVWDMVFAGSDAPSATVLRYPRTRLSKGKVRITGYIVVEAFWVDGVNQILVNKSGTCNVKLHFQDF